MFGFGKETVPVEPEMSPIEKYEAAKENAKKVIGPAIIEMVSAKIKAANFQDSSGGANLMMKAEDLIAEMKEKLDQL